MLSLQDQGLSALLNLAPTDAPHAVNSKLICFFLAGGEPAAAVAKKLGVSEETVTRVAGSDDGGALIIRLQTALFPDPAIRVRKLAHAALDVKTKLLFSTGNDVLRNNVATDILDRTMGKATQVTENRNINFDIKDVEGLDRQIAASQERLSAIDKMKRTLGSAKTV